MSDITINHLCFRIMDASRILSAQPLRGDGVLLALTINGGGVTFELTADQAHQLAQWLMSPHVCPRKDIR